MRIFTSWWERGLAPKYERITEHTVNKTHLHLIFIRRIFFPKIFSWLRESAQCCPPLGSLFLRDKRFISSGLRGGIQPSKLAPLVQSAVNGKNDDGLIQRLQLAVWPDTQKTWKWVDKAPNPIASQNYTDQFIKLHNYKPENKAHRFDNNAQPLFVAWMEEIQLKARDIDTSDIMSSYLLKLPKTITAIALIFHIILNDTGEASSKNINTIGEKATAMALDWADYLISHFNRICSWANNSYIEAAKLIVRRRGKLPVPFKARDISNTGWAGVGSTSDIYDALELLVDHNYLIEQQNVIGSAGGRPSRMFYWSSAVEEI